ncbi:uncharacterized protein [Antedon mediterranea]|uniref:uncharacterized protein n=1 Tax=Antedon mediterranea TaxID=105859 RepID=UPI003AF91BE6
MFKIVAICVICFFLQYRSDATDTTAKIIIYDHTHFKGPLRVLTNNEDNLGDIGFNDRLSSIKVQGSVWVGYEHSQFHGRQYILEEGEYPTPQAWKGSNDKLSSLKRLSTAPLSKSPFIILYEHGQFRGKSHRFTYKISSLGAYGFNDKLSSLKVIRGTWILYEHGGYSGRQFIVTEGEYRNGYGGNDIISSLRPVLEPNFPTEIISMTFDIDSSILQTTPEVLFNKVVNNNGGSIQTPSWGTSFSTSRTKTYEWNWENSLTIGVTTTFKTGVPIIAEAKVTTSVENTFSVGETRSSENTQSETWSVTLPSSVAAYTRLRVKVIVQNGKIDVPFTAVLKKGPRQWEERGVYTGTQSYNMVVDYTEEPLPQGDTE